METLTPHVYPRQAEPTAEQPAILARLERVGRWLAATEEAIDATIDPDVRATAAHMLAEIATSAGVLVAELRKPTSTTTSSAGGAP